MLRLQDISFAYPARNGQVSGAVLDRVTADFNAGQISVIVGPSGCGKTTLLNIIAGLLTPTNGTIEHAGDERGKPSVGYVFQTPSLIPWRTIRENALFGAEVRERKRTEVENRCNDLMAAHGLRGFESAYPSALSGGMQQRVSIIRAVLSGAKTILLDEPFSNSDFVMRRALQKELSRLVIGDSLVAILVTHDFEEAVRIADKLIVLSTRPARIKEVIEITVPRSERLEGSASVMREMASYVERLETTFAKSAQQLEGCA